MGLLKGFFGLCGRKEPFHIGGKNGLVFNDRITYRRLFDYDSHVDAMSVTMCMPLPITGERFVGK